VPAPPPTTATETPATSTAPDARALYTQALTQLNTGNTTEAARLMEEAADAGLTIAQYRLGTFYETGEGVTQNAATARDWYARAADGGNARAMHNLAVLYAGGALGGSPDYAQAAHWFAEAAAYDIRDSQFNLGVLFERGLGVRTDLNQAYLWYSIAERGGDQEAGARRAQLAGQLDDADRARIDAAAANWHPRPLDPVANGQLSVSHPLGASPAEIAQAQRLLTALGYAPGTADGVMGPQTAASIRNFERSAGMAVTGRVTQELISRLEAETVARHSGG
jgi:localization factor PodJL